MRGARHHDGRIRVDHLDMRLRDEEVAIGIRRSTDDTNLDLQPTLRHAVAGYGLRGLPIEPDRGEFIRTGHAAVPVLHLAACVPCRVAEPFHLFPEFDARQVEHGLAAFA